VHRSPAEDLIAAVVKPYIVATNLEPGTRPPAAAP
jgi:hypothetical protein